jgi:hypothetical protein
VEVVDCADEIELGVYGMAAAVVEVAAEPLEELCESRFDQGTALTVLGSAGRSGKAGGHLVVPEKVTGLCVQVEGAAATAAAGAEDDVDGGGAVGGLRPRASRRRLPRTINPMPGRSAEAGAPPPQGGHAGSNPVVQAGEFGVP